MDLFTRTPSTSPPEPLSGKEYLTLLHKYLTTNLPRLAPTSPPPASILQQSYTLLTLGLDPSSQPLHRSLKVPLTLGFGTPSTPKGPLRPLTLRLPPDRLLYLLLRWQALPQNLAHVGRTDVPIEEGVPFTARGATERVVNGQLDGDVQSVRSWVGSMRSVSMGSMVPGMGGIGKGWWGKEEPNEDQILLALYSMFKVLPALLIHPPFMTDRPISELIEAGGYTQFGGVDVRVPLDTLRNLQVLELEAYDPRALLIPSNPNLHSLTVRDVQDGDDWIEELLTVPPPKTPSMADPNPSQPQPRFAHLRHLSLPSCSLLSFPTLPLSTLTSLDLSHNLLNAIPTSLSSLPTLSSLNLSYNLIISTRNAPSALLSLTTLNISHNRLDCLVGLDRIPTLQRIDLRTNDLPESGEVGRLAVLPKIKGIWTSGNPFNSTNAAVGGGDWRIDLGVTFAQEGKSVILDDIPFSWVEKRNIDAILAATGRGRGKDDGRSPIKAAVSSGSVRLARPGGENGVNSANSTLARNTPPPPPVVLIQNDTQILTGSSTSKTKTIVPPPPASPTPSTSTTATGIVGGKKRRPRRLIDLDSTDDVEVVKGGSLRLPPKSVLHEEEEEREVGMGKKDTGVDDNTSIKKGDGEVGRERPTGEVVVVKKGRRARVSASMFEP